MGSKGNTSKMWRYMNDMIGKKRTRSPYTLHIGEEVITDQHEVVEEDLNGFYLILFFLNLFWKTKVYASHIISWADYLQK